MLVEGGGNGGRERQETGNWAAVSVTHRLHCELPSNRCKEGKQRSHGLPLPMSCIRTGHWRGEAAPLVLVEISPQDPQRRLAQSRCWLGVSSHRCQDLRVSGGLIEAALRSSGRGGVARCSGLGSVRGSQAEGEGGGGS